VAFWKRQGYWGRLQRWMVVLNEGRDEGQGARMRVFFDMMWLGFFAGGGHKCSETRFHCVAPAALEISWSSCPRWIYRQEIILGANCSTYVNLYM
jgi:hypothetical protein